MNIELINLESFSSLICQHLKTIEVSLELLTIGRIVIRTAKQNSYKGSSKDLSIPG